MALFDRWLKPPRTTAAAPLQPEPSACATPSKVGAGESELALCEVDALTLRHLRVSPRYAALVGWDQADLLAHPDPTALLHPEEHERLMQGWAAIMQSGGSGEVELRLRRQDGGYAWCRCILSVSARHADGQPSRCLIHLRPLED